VDLRFPLLDMSASPGGCGFAVARLLRYSSAQHAVTSYVFECPALHRPSPRKMGHETFDLRCSDSEFRLHCGDPTPPHLTLIKVRYTSDDISGLELKGRAKRGGSLTTAKLDSLPEILRALGHYVDSKGGRLVRICNGDVALDSSLIMLEYETRHRQVRREDFSITSIYKHTQDMHHERSRISPDIRWA